MTSDKQSITKRVAAWLEDGKQAVLLTSTDPQALRSTIDELASGLHPGDIIRVTDEEAASISVKRVRAVLGEASATSWGEWRLVVIEQAERLTPESANTLLKALEEPRSKTRWLLTTQWQRRLLPTILSRVAHFHLPPIAATVASGSAEGGLLTNSLFERLAEHRGDKELTQDELAALAAALSTQLKQQGPSPQLRAAMMRLRDYYRITSRKAGNQKLARDVLLASLPE